MSNATIKQTVDEFRQRTNGQVVLVLQGGGALGAYQVGVYQALHEANVEPDWVIGTSIGAINAGLIAGNRFEDRLSRLDEFWKRVQRPSYLAVGERHTGLRGVFRHVVVLADARRWHPRILQAQLGVLGRKSFAGSK